MRPPLIRAFDSYTSTDGGNTWTANPSGRRCCLPPPTRRCRAETCLSSSRKHHDLCHRRQGCAQQQPRPTSSGSWTATRPIPAARSTPRGPAGPQGLDPGGLQRLVLQFNGYTQGPGYYGKTFFIWPPDPRNGSITLEQHTQLKTFLDRSRHQQCDGPDHSRLPTGAPGRARARPPA